MAGDPINPEHYKPGDVYEAINVIEAWGLGFCLGNAVKYICRAGKKTPDAREDLLKAIWYLQREAGVYVERNHRSRQHLTEWVAADDDLSDVPQADPG